MDSAILKTILVDLAANDFDVDLNALKLSGNVCADSRSIAAGDIFVAVAGPLADGHDYINVAVKNGAVLVITQRLVPDCAVPVVLVNDSATALAKLAQFSFGNPAKKLKCLGITGTNGKTTIAYLTQYILQTCDIPCGMIGTIGYCLGKGQVVEANNTTPGSVELAKMMSVMAANGLQAMVMECSSHGLDQKRTAAIDFTAAAFSNISGDHIDYHGNMENYIAAKALLFESLKPEAMAIINKCDSAAAKMIANTPAKICYYAIDGDGDLTATIKAMGLWGCDVELSYAGGSYALRLPMIGEHNVDNMLAACGLALSCGIEIEKIIAAIETFPGVPGRLEKVSGKQNFEVLVDYAHTDDALDHALKTLKQLEPKKLTVIFGCGGDRDQSKRPRMAKVAAKWADKIIITNDNPRSEDPLKIIEQIKQGFSEDDNVIVIPDRFEAIAHAIKNAIDDEAILIAGKGHEDYQVIGGQVLDFDDRKVACELILDKLRVEN